MANPQSARILRAVLIAAVVTLVVNLVRLYGELEQWSPKVFNREAGGGMALLGISWLVIPFGFWFGRLLAQNGHRPKSTGKALLWCLGGLVVVTLVGFVAVYFFGQTQAEKDAGTKLTAEQMKSFTLTFTFGAAAGGLLLLVGWARAWMVLAFYGILARVPVIVIQYFAVEKQWDTHFSKGAPGAPPDMLLFGLTMAQCGFWPFGFTVLIGGVFAILGAWTVKSAAPA